MPTRRPHRSHLLAILLLLFLSACLPQAPLPGAPFPTPNQPDNWYSIYFTDPTGPAAETLRGGPDAALAQAIAAARVSVDLAIYDFDLWSLRDALLAAQRRGVSVRLVVESDNFDEPEIQELIDAGIPVLGDRREGLMHDKFAIIDRQEVWTGSMNFTVNGAYRNDNNLLRLRSTRLAADYLAEFEEMFVEDAFGPGSPANTPYPSLVVDGTRVEVYFSPEDDTAARLVELVADARESVYFLAYSFTADDLSTALLARAPAGVTISGVFEESQYRSNTGAEFERLLSGGLDVRLDGNPRNMHHKVLIIDQQIVVTGSYNFSASAAERNDENTLVIHNAGIAAAYLEEFQRIYAAAQH